MTVVLVREDVTSWRFLHEEPRGASEKYWITEPVDSSKASGAHWLFKPAKVHSNGNRQVGDWTEAVASSIAFQLDIPAAEARVVIRDGVEGVISKNIKPEDFDMEAGHMAILDQIGVELRSSVQNRSATSGHSLSNIKQALEGYNPPPGWDAWQRCTAFDVFSGFLILDALIGNTDRHEGNWSVLRARTYGEGLDALAPAYDMEASLGFQLTDSDRSRRLNEVASLESFAAKGIARRFDGDTDHSLVELAVKATKNCSEAGQTRITALVEQIATMSFIEQLEAHGGVSEVTRTFAGAILEINGRRLQDAINA